MAEEAGVQQGNTEQQTEQASANDDQQFTESSNLFDGKEEQGTEESSDAGNLFDEGDGGGKEADGGTEDGENKGVETEGAPEEYEDFEMPEGIDYDSEIGGEFKELAKEMNLPQEQAQKFADLGAKLIAKQQGSLIKAWNDQVAEWQKDIKSDPEIGGSNLKPTLGGVRSAIEQFAASPEDAKEILDNPVVSNRPAFVRLMNNVRKSISEGSAIEGKAGDRTEVPLYDRLWPDDK